MRGNEELMDNFGVLGGLDPVDGQVNTRWNYKTINPSIHPSSSQSINQSINQSFNQSIKQVKPGKGAFRI